MSYDFFEQPILNSPYEYPNKHWELDQSGQPTFDVIEKRRRAEFITPIPKPKGRNKELEFGDDEGLSTASQRYEVVRINSIREQVDKWRRLPQAQWKVTPETARLLDHWRNFKFADVRPFFCQVEAVETLIWLSEVAPHSQIGRDILSELSRASADANPELERYALKLATGAGKTTVMAMVIAWQTLNAVRRRGSNRFTNGFLVVTPGITIKDRLQVLQPNDPYSYYKSRQLVPDDMLEDMNKAKIVITNYHAFKLRERVDLSKGGRALLKGHSGVLNTMETEGQMLQRVMSELTGMKNIFVLNDEAHHCYREKPPENDDVVLKGDEKDEAEKNNEAARLWISGIETVKRNLGVIKVADLSATPFFLSGSGYREGTIFPWTVSDFSLMDAIECGIVKLPRVPISQNVISDDEMPMYRNLWKHIGKKMPKKGRGKGAALDPSDLPPQLQTALEALYGHYEKTYELWKRDGITIPPCFIIVCNNTASSKLVYDLISGYTVDKADGSTEFFAGRFPLFSNFDPNGDPYPRPNTLLIDSEQLESGDALDPNFHKFAQREIDQFRREIVERTGDVRSAEKLSDAELLREVMNTVGKTGRLGGDIRCVVSVSMLTEGWDANNVTHVLGVRAFGTQLLCEQVIGRALRRQSYSLNEAGLFNVEYADILGIPFDFTAKPVIAKPTPPRETVHVRAIRPERDALEIKFPRVQGYRVKLPEDNITATFDKDTSTLVLSPDDIGATEVQNSGIIGAPVDLTLAHTGDVRPSQVIFELTAYLVRFKWRDENGDPRLNQFGALKRIVKRWIDEGYLVCRGGTYQAQLKYKTLADRACDKIIAAITTAHAIDSPIEAILDPYVPEGSTAFVSFNTSKLPRWETSPARCHVNWAVLDSEWEKEFCRVAESHPKVRAYVKNSGLGFEVPYNDGGEARRYLPDFIVLVDDGHGDDDLLRVVVEIKGFQNENSKAKRETMNAYWVPGVNNLGTYGRWKFVELADFYEIKEDFETIISPRAVNTFDQLASIQKNG